METRLSDSPTIFAATTWALTVSVEPPGIILGLDYVSLPGLLADVEPETIFVALTREQASQLSEEIAQTLCKSRQ